MPDAGCRSVVELRPHRSTVPIRTANYFSCLRSTFLSPQNMSQLTILTPCTFTINRNYVIAERQLSVYLHKSKGG